MDISSASAIVPVHRRGRAARRASVNLPRDAIGLWFGESYREVATPAGQ